MNNNAVLRRYTWSPVGLDTPISVYDASANATYYYNTDANKNITELTDATGAVVAHYEYSPFGKVLVANGTYASINPFRFSSEYHDDETALVYYNYRYYSPELGRWMSRDPIGEKGGENLYAIADNSLIDFYDILGHAAISFEFNGPQTPLGISFFARFSATTTDCPFSIEGGLFVAAEWQPPGLRYIKKPLDYINVHVEFGMRAGIQGKIKFSECSMHAETKLCMRVEAFGRAEYRKKGFRDHGKFSRLRFGAGADGGCDFCIDFCSGMITADCAVSYYAYANLGFSWFNRTYNAGGSASASFNFGSFSRLAILSGYCGRKASTTSDCCCEKGK